MQNRSPTRLQNRLHIRNNSVVSARVEKVHFPTAKRMIRAAARSQKSHLPPENWYEPSESGCGSFKVIVQEAGRGFRHVVTEDQLRARLAELPAALVKSLQVIQLSRMTRKKKTFPCYGMQWGNALYLYPMEESLIECYRRPPTPGQRIEAQMYGGEWRQTGSRDWQLVWTEDSIRNYYLNNILLHELGHLLDQRNTSYRDRERYAEWFAIEHGINRQRKAQVVQRPRSQAAIS